MKVTISSKGQIVIPASVRRQHGMEAGQEWVLVDMGTHVALVRASEDPIRAAHGMLAGALTTDDFLAHRRAERELEDRLDARVMGDE